MTRSDQRIQRLLRTQSIGAVRLVGGHVVWRRALDQFAIWPECNVYSAAPPGRRYALKQAIQVLTNEEMQP